MGKKSRREKRRNRHGVEYEPGTKNDPEIMAALERMTPEDLEADNYAMEQDRRFSETYPDALKWEREPYRGEWRHHTPPGRYCAAVQVTVMGPGMRIRQPIWFHVSGRATVDLDTRKEKRRENLPGQRGDLCSL